MDSSGHHSKHVDELAAVPFDYIVTVCDHALETCPVFPDRVKRLHVGFDNPPRLAKDAKTEALALVPYYRVPDEIRAFVEHLPAALDQQEATR